MKTNTQRIISRALIQMVYVDLLFLSIYVMAVWSVNHFPATPEVLLIGSLFLVQWVQVFALGWQTTNEAALDWRDAPQEAPKQDPDAVDPWKLQKALMRASDQPLPTSPVLNRGGLLYSALLMEEVGETMAGLAKATREADMPATSAGPESNALLVIFLLFRNTSQHLLAESKRLRELLQDVNMEFKLPQACAIEILDGTTDVAVVNSGLALAMGLPGAEAYLEVGCSNLSKANPATGVIDKLPDGKWIKGSQYFPPNLASVLSIHEDYSAK